MEAYFKFRLFLEVVIPILVILLVIFCFLYGILVTHFRFRLMKKLGYTYKPGLGKNVALEFQSRWEKGNVKINWRKVDSLKYREIKKYVGLQEERHNGRL